MESRNERLFLVSVNTQLLGLLLQQEWFYRNPLEHIRRIDKLLMVFGDEILARLLGLDFY
jgi:hypothetical protein